MSLPTELIEHIVSDVDKASLKAYTLISWPWVAPSRRLISRAIDPYYQELPALHRFLKDTSYVGPFVKIFVLAYDCTLDHCLTFHVDAGLVFRVLSMFTSLEVAELCGVCLHFVNPSMTLSPLSSTLRNLTLRFYDGHRPYLLLMHHLPGLVSLRLLGDDFISEEAGDKEVKLLSSLALEHLEISESTFQVVLHGLLHTATAQRLRCLKLDTSARERCTGDMACLKQFLRVVSGQLEELDWRYGGSEPVLLCLP